MDAVSREVAHILNQCGYPLSFPGQYYFKDDAGRVQGVQLASSDVYEAGWKDNGAGGKELASSDQEIRMAAPSIMEAIQWIEARTPADFRRIDGDWVMMSTDAAWELDNPVHEAIYIGAYHIMTTLNGLHKK